VSSSFVAAKCPLAAPKPARSGARDARPSQGLAVESSLAPRSTQKGELRGPRSQVIHEAASKGSLVGKTEGRPRGIVARIAPAFPAPQKRPNQQGL
jgi:hypothetical protein